MRWRSFFACLNVDRAIEVARVTPCAGVATIAGHLPVVATAPSAATNGESPCCIFVGHTDTALLARRQSRDGRHLTIAHGGETCGENLLKKLSQHLEDPSRRGHTGSTLPGELGTLETIC